MEPAKNPVMISRVKKEEVYGEHLPQNAPPCVMIFFKAGYFYLSVSYPAASFQGLVSTPHGYSIGIPLIGTPVCQNSVL
jgi:hypothetical protein